MAHSNSNNLALNIMSDTDTQSQLTSNQRQINYTALSQLGGQSAHIQFYGTFKDREVLWDTQLITLREIYRQGLAVGK